MAGHIGQQPQMVQMQAQLPLEQWKHGICGCFDNCGNCLYAFLCPVCAMASARSRFDESNFCFNCLCLSGPVLRNIVREGYHIQGNCISDICCALCLGPCSQCQVLNEVTSRGMVKYTWGANRSPTPVDFQYGLFSCFSNCENCLYAFFCTSCAFASSRSRFDSSNWLFNCCCLSPCLVRSIVREGYNIKGTCIHDICLPLLCTWCTAAQLLNEVAYRGEVSKTIILVPKQ